MAIASNIETLLGFKTTLSGHTLRPPELQTEYPACGRTFGGSNFYYGINPTNVGTFTDSGGTQALNGEHIAFFNDLAAELLASEQPTITVMLGVEPPPQADPYGFVTAHTDMVSALASALNEYQAQAKAAGKELRIVIRYASEMNDTARSDNGEPANWYAGDPAAFKASFLQVRNVFSNEAPDVLFAFSPAIRADLTEDVLTNYWPGDHLVDVVSCTWYIGSPPQAQKSTAFFMTYFLHRHGLGKLFAIDELGGCETMTLPGGGEIGKDCDVWLQKMSATIHGLAAAGIEFSHATLFLDSKWGTDATLSWV